jgi:hypothetical protein
MQIFGRYSLTKSSNMMILKMREKVFQLLQVLEQTILVGSPANKTVNILQASMDTFRILLQTALILPQRI